MIDFSNFEVVDEFKLFGITIDQNLFFNKYVVRMGTLIENK